MQWTALAGCNVDRGAAGTTAWPLAILSLIACNDVDDVRIGRKALNGAFSNC